MPNERIIAKAQEFLIKQPFDAGHDLEHHKTVLQLALDIASHIDEPVDVEALEIAVMWHDVVTDDDIDPNVADRNEIKLKTCEYLRNLLPAAGYSLDFINQVILAVQYHSFEDKPRNTLGRVLYDADKLAAVDISRWRKVVQAHKAQKMSDENFNNYITAGKRWLSEMKDKLHFEYSMKLFGQRMTAIAQDEWAKELAVGMGVNLEDFLS